MPESAAALRSFSFVLAVPDLERSASYFRDTLGFRLEWPPGSGWQLASRGAVRIMIGHCPDAMAPSATGDHSYFGYIHVDDIDALHREFAGKGAIILQPPADKPHGMRELVVATPDGHRMMFGQELAAATRADSR
ncbi:MAG TPA: VOC family protein [Paraburkholderia sp.]|jgi:catechol 2,3-dioxygenase-like lactoylglutathione lyase family enzyme|nr:VOC family protein [Paraburkholderia sp.]